MSRLRSLLLFSTLALGAAVPLGAQSIVIAPGSGPAGGYLGLSIFSGNVHLSLTDDSFQTLNVPSFNWGGAMYDQVVVSSNGFVVAGNSTAGADNFVPQQVPSPVPPNNVLAPFWTDLNPAAGGQVLANVLTDGSHNWLVVDWEQVPLFSIPTATNTFEIWLQTGGTEGITFSYADLAANPGPLMVGAENESGTVGDTYYYQLTSATGTGTLPPSHSELRVMSIGNPNVVPEPATLPLLGTGMLGLAGFIRRKRAA